MKPEPAPPVDAEHAAFMQSGISLVVGTCDRKLRPSAARATGCRISADRRRVTIFISATQGAEVLRCIRENGAIAVVFSKPSTHRTVQLKGRDAVVAGLGDDDLRLIDEYRIAFAREIEPLGFDEILVHTFLACPPADIVSLSFTPTEAYSQTPGPSAGEPLKMRS